MIFETLVENLKSQAVFLHVCVHVKAAFKTVEGISMSTSYNNAEEAT